MRKCCTLFVGLSLLLISTAGCTQFSSATAPSSSSALPSMSNTFEAAICTVAEPNVLLVISDEANDITAFTELWIYISGVGFVPGDGEGIVEEGFEPPAWVNLVDLTGEDAIALWAGYVPENDYTKVFLYVDEVWGLLADSEERIEIKLPSNKLQLDMPLEVSTEEATEFVFDITVVKAGNSGQYILKPQITESGQGVTYRLLERTRERIRVDRPDWAGKPDWAGQNDEDDESGQPNPAAKPDWAGKPGWTSEDGDEAAPKGDKDPGRPQGAGRPEGAGKPLEDTEPPNT